MSSQIEKFVMGFFKNLKCDVLMKDGVLIVDSVPKSFEDLYGRVAPYRLGFVSGMKDCDFVGKGGALLTAMSKFLQGVGKTTLLKIDFDVDPMAEINKALSLKNCKIDNLVKRHRNNFFSRFTFMTTFRYLNEAERVVNEIYVHDGMVVEGDLSGYKVCETIENREQKIDIDVKRDYGIAREVLKGMLVEKTAEIGGALGKTAEKEIERIRYHYENLMGELGGDLSGAIEKVREVELELRNAEDKDKDVLRVRLDRLRKGLVKIGDDEARDKILKEQEFTIKDAMHKHSLNIDNKLVNTTVIYYPVFSFNLFLKGDNGGRYVEMNYDPLTRTLNKLVCESCGKDIVRLNLCAAGHISCDDCLEKCGECGKAFCGKCMKRSCSSCGKPLCKSCAKMCRGCGKCVCENHMRRDCVSGDDRCVLCLRACLRCHGYSQERFFGEALDGSKVCSKCLGAEKRGRVLDGVFRD